MTPGRQASKLDETWKTSSQGVSKMMGFLSNRRERGVRGEKTKDFSALARPRTEGVAYSAKKKPKKPTKLGAPYSIHIRRGAQFVVYCWPLSWLDGNNRLF